MCTFTSGALVWAVTCGGGQCVSVFFLSQLEHRGGIFSLFYFQSAAWYFVAGHEFQTKEDVSDLWPDHRWQMNIEPVVKLIYLWHTYRLSPFKKRTGRVCSCSLSAVVAITSPAAFSKIKKQFKYGIFLFFKRSSVPKQPQAVSQLYKYIHVCTLWLGSLTSLKTFFFFSSS